MRLAGRGIRLPGLLSVVLVALLGTSAAIVGSSFVRARNVGESHAQYVLSATEVTDELTNVLLRYGDLLSGSSALFHQGGLTREEYDVYLRDIGFGSTRFPELRGIGFIKMALPRQVPSFLASLRRDGHDVLAVVPAGRRSTYCLGSYMEPDHLPLGIQPFGYDFCRAPFTSGLLARATTTGVQQVFSGLRMPAPYTSLLILVQPVFRGRPWTASQRQHLLMGWVVGFFDGPGILKSIPSVPGIQFAVFSARTGAAATSPVLQSTTALEHVRSWTLSDTISSYGGWIIRFRLTPGSSQPGVDTSGPIWLLIVGLVAVGLLIALLSSLMTARRRADRTVAQATSLLKSSEERFKSLSSAAPIGIIEVTPSRGVVYANPKMAEISGKDLDALLGAGWLDSVHPDDVGELLEMVESVRESRSQFSMSFRVVHHPDGEVRHVRVMAAPKPELDDGAYVVSIEDVTDEVTSRQELTYRAFHDALTGLPNRALFLDRLNLEIARNERGRAKFAVLFLDLDEFKVVNDSLGHESGDEVLKVLGSRFQRALRKGETAARFSGDEFAFILSDVACEADAVAAARRLLALLEPAISIVDHELSVTGSIGIVIPAWGTDATAILRDADAAMYRAKEEGRNRYSFFDDELRRRSVARFAVEVELRKALDEHQFELYFQPAVEPSSGRPFAAEALIRWHHPTRGLVPPLEFIPVAEASRLIRPIGRWVIEQAVAQLSAWDAMPGGPALTVLSVNLSASQLEDPGTLELVHRVLESNGIEPGRLCIEVTESVAMSTNPQSRLALEGFRELGLRVAIDDFGTGYSSLAYLHELPVTTLKIDQTFIARLGGQDDSTPVVRAVVEMGHAIGLRVVAEGVSDELLRDAVARLGCDVAQGFYWARPMPRDRFVAWWREASARAASTPRAAGAALSIPAPV